jgi:hypothetical protein
MSPSAPSGTLSASFAAEGDLWIGTSGNGLWHSTNFGATWTRAASAAVSTAYQVGFGKSAAGQSYPAIYIAGSANSTTGFFRSDDGGATWTTISDAQHQYGYVGPIVGDRNVYGRCYIGAGARGIIYGEIQSTAPSVTSAAAASPNPVTGATVALGVLGADDGGEASLTYTWRVTHKPPGSSAPNFSVNGTNAAKNTTVTFSQKGYYSFDVAITDAQGHTMVSSVGTNVTSVPVDLGVFAAANDIGSPSPTGSSSYNAGSDVYTVSGGGSDIWNASDQFHYLSKDLTGNASIIARVTSVQNTNTWAKAGVMFRNSTAADAMFADVVITPSSGVSFQWRSSTGGNCGSAQVTGVTAPKWVKLLRSGNSFTAFYASTTATPAASDWIQVGVAQTIAMNNTARVGLAVTSHNNGTSCTAMFTGLNIATDFTPPTLSSGTFNYKTNQSLSFAFSEDVLASLGAGDFVVRNSDTNAVVSAAEWTFGATGGSGVPSVATLTHNVSAGLLPDGHYSVAISNVFDAAGNAMAATSWPFFVLTADANHDGYVNAQDFTALAQNFNSTSGSYDKGDFNYDGNVNALDFSALASRFGATSAALPSSAPSGATALAFAKPAANLFSLDSISSDPANGLLDSAPSDVPLVPWPEGKSL